MKLALLFGVALLSGAATGISLAKDATWTGAGTDPKWETASNWADNAVPSAGDVLVFSGTVTSARNTTPNFAVGGLTFTADADAFQVGGKPIKLKGDIANNSKSEQTLNFYITLLRNITVTAGSDIALGGAVRGDHFGIEKNGIGQLTLRNANTYTGPTTVHAGMLLLASDHAIDPASTLVMDGGQLGLDANVSPAIGPLQVKSPMVLDFGSGNHALAFANSNALPWTGTLAIYNWDSDAQLTHAIRFGTDNKGLTDAQLQAITFYRDAGKMALGHATWATNTGALTPAK
jgi:autotransporter-associated beta strand protein